MSALNYGAYHFEASIRKRELQVHRSIESRTPLPDLSRPDYSSPRLAKMRQALDWYTQDVLDAKEEEERERKTSLHGKDSWKRRTSMKRIA